MPATIEPDVAVGGQKAAAVDFEPPETLDGTQSVPASNSAHFLVMGFSGNRLLTLVRSCTERIARAKSGATVMTEMFSG